MLSPQYKLDLNGELIIDNFAGGGGASTGIEQATGRHVDIAINHDRKAIAMHVANHPQTVHFCESVWDVNPREVIKGRRVALVWLSPDCKHFSKAKGGKPVEKKIRGLAWVALKWASLPKDEGKPRVIMLENVEEFVTWGPLASDGKPCKKNKGREFQAFKNALAAHGFVVEHRELRASDFGAPTIRKRFFMIARSDGQPIVWPEPTHGDPAGKAFKAGNLLPWRTAAECIDWSIPCPSIFDRKKPLAETTMRRVAKGMMRYVIDNPKPFIVPVTHQGSVRVNSIDEPFRTITGANRGELAVCAPFMTEHANSSSQRVFDADEPLRTQCAQVKGGHFSVVAPTLISMGYGERPGQSPRVPGLDKPLGTLVGTKKHALVTAFLAQFNNTGNGKPNVGHPATDPLSTITASATLQGVVAANIVRQFGNSDAADIDAPLGTIVAGGGGKSLLETSFLSKLRGTNVGDKADAPLHTISAGGTHHAEVRALLIKYYGTDQDPQLGEPLHTITTKDRFALVIIDGDVYEITDIGLRMLWPHELFLAQSFPRDYIIDRGLIIHPDGKVEWIKLTKSDQVKMCGNSVPPVLARALVAANIGLMVGQKEEVPA